MIRNESRGKSNNDNLYNSVTYPTDSARPKKSASNKDKFSQEEITAHYIEHLQTILNRIIFLHEKKAKSAYCKKNGINDIDDITDADENLDGYLFSYKSKVIKSALAAHKQMITDIEENYQREIRYSREAKYILHESPLWMMKDEKIVQNFERFSFTIPILNYLWNYNRHTRGPKLKEMFSLTKDITGGEIYITEKKKKYEYATFVTDEKFYEKMADKIDCSQNYLQKYLMTLSKIGIIKKLGNVGRNGTLYTDGYYVPWDGTYRKEVFLKNTRVFKEALRSFNPLAK
jgi:hypothetical protein